MPNIGDVLNIQLKNIVIVIAIITLLLILWYFTRNESFTMEEKKVIAADIHEKTKPLFSGGSSNGNGSASVSLDKLKSTIPEYNPDAVLYTDLKNLAKDDKFSVNNIIDVL